MASALELYYQNKKASPVLERRIDSELVGDLKKKYSPGFFSKLLDLLDRPGNATRALLVGKLGGLKGLIPFAKVIEELTGWDVALNPDERVTGEQVINKLFGKQRQRKGKIDPVDVLGFLVEVAADPLWLVWGPGLTKLGKAKQLVAGALKAGDAKVISAALKTGNMTGVTSKKLVKAIRTLHKSKATPGLAKGWAAQAAKGERAALHLGFPGHRVTVPGKKFFDISEKTTKLLKNSWLGKKFLPPTRRVSSKFSELHDIMVHHARDLPDAQRSVFLEKYTRWMNNMGKIGDIDTINRKMTDFVESSVSGQHLKRYIADVKALRYKGATKASQRYFREINKLQKKIQTQYKTLEKAKVVPVRPKPTPRRVPSKAEIGVVPKIKGFAGKPKALTKREISAAQRRLQERIRRANKKAQLAYERRTAKDLAAMRARVKTPKTLIKHYEKELQQAHGRIKRLFKVAGRDDLKAFEKARARSAQLQTRAAEIIESIPESQRGRFRVMAEGFRKDTEKMLRAERGLLVPAKELSDEALLGYVRRELTEDARKWLAQNNQRFLRRSKAFGVRSGAQVRRKKLLAGMTRDEINSMFKELGFKGENVFEPGIAQATFARAAMSARTTGSAKGLHEAIRKFAVPIAEATDDAVPLLDFAESTGLKIGAAQRVMWGQKAIPSEVARALQATNELVSSPEAIDNVITSVQRYMKGLFTIPFPAYHGRNAISNVFLNWIAGVKNPASYKIAAQLQRAASQTQKLVRQGIPWEQAARQVSWPSIQTATGLTDGAAFWRLSDDWGIIHRSLGEMGATEVAGASKLKTGGRAAKRAHDKLWEVGRRGTMAIEDNARLAHFIEKTASGLDPQTAARSVKKVLFDYGDLSQFEKKVLRDKVFFFYTFARKNLPLQVETLITQPGKQALFAHAAGGTPRAGERENYPDYWQERLTIPLGRDKVVAGTGLPIEEAFGPIAAPGVGGVNRIRRILSRAMSRLYPTWTVPTELATGHQLYFDKPIRDYSRWFHQKMPYGRFYSTYGQIARPGEPVGGKILRHTLGPRVIDYNPEEAAQRKIQEISRRYLEKQKAVRTFKRPYLPPGQRSSEMIDMALQLQRK
jgi:ferritin-like metal-binding protein YciE